MRGRLVALVVAAGAVAAGCSSTSTSTPAAITFSARPVLCYAPPAHSSATSVSPSSLPACSAASELSAARLHVAPAPSTYAGYTANLVVPPDPAFAAYRSTTPAEDTPAATVLLGPATSNPSKLRYVLGPASLTRSEVTSAVAYDEGGHWVDNVVLTKAGAAGLQSLEKTQFHAPIAFVVNSKVLAPTLVQPTAKTESAPGMVFQLIAGLNESEAKQLAAELS